MDEFETNEISPIDSIGESDISLLIEPDDSHELVLDKIEKFSMEVESFNRKIKKLYKMWRLSPLPKSKQDYFDALRGSNTPYSHILRMMEMKGEGFGKDCVINDKTYITVYTESAILDEDKMRFIASKAIREVTKHDDQDDGGLKIDFVTFIRALERISTYSFIPKWRIVQGLIGKDTFEKCMIERQEELDKKLVELFSQPTLDIQFTNDISLMQRMKRDRDYLKYMPSSIGNEQLQALKSKFDSLVERRENGTGIGLNQHTFTIWIVKSGILNNVLDSVKVDDLFAQMLNREDRKFRQNIQGKHINFEEFLELLGPICIRLTNAYMKTCVKHLISTTDISIISSELELVKPTIEIKIEPEIKLDELTAATDFHVKLKKVIEKKKKTHLTEDQSNRLEALFRVFSKQGARRTTKRKPGEPRMYINGCVKWLQACEIVDRSYDPNFLDKDFRIILNQMHKQGDETTFAEYLDFAGFIQLIILIAERKDTRPEAIFSLIFHGPFEEHYQTLDL